jgi:acyl carrier protein
MATSLSDDELMAVIRSAIGQVAPEADPSRLAPDDDIVEMLELDSMDVLNIMTAIAERTGLEVPERDYPETRTLRLFVAELNRLARA